MESTRSLRTTKYRKAVPSSQDNIDLFGTGFLYDSPMELNRWIIEARARAQLTQQQLADALGVTKSNVSAWENSRHDPSWSQMLKIRAVTGAALPIEDAGPAAAEQSWPFSFPRAKLDQLSQKQIAQLDKILAAAIDLASEGKPVTASPFSTSGTAGEPESTAKEVKKTG
ncbi:helix-turn-helix transcriptional regulator [Cupriavidus sp. DB3]|uniref:helix-turn-helix transcriptional regulator n=1 Tax=Cupriavidus sp. DB3 TaxID=2873259 RepID=UPI001CF2BFAB|nr:helix-turn-helix transcriptional regulator [Cupriavidus sp. DB3]MCA7083421.1 helix-turn-helix transcriptional regulator [Cupriavidus sp. DB3]